MKKIDLHIHTRKTISDSDFIFSITRLQQYVNEMKIDAIAVIYEYREDVQGDLYGDIRC